MHDYQPVSVDAAATAVSAQGLPTDVLGLMRHLFTDVLDGRDSPTTDGVQRALGCAPRDFSDYARDAAASGAWTVEIRVAA